MAPPGPAAAPAGAAREVFATAERIHDVAWTLRERGLDPSTCDQIEALAASVLSASSLRDPSNGRAHQLGEVLQYLERRISAMLDSDAAQTPGAGEADEAADVHAAGNGHGAFAPDAAPPTEAATPALPGLAEAAPMPIEPVVSAAHPMLHGLEAGPVALVEPDADLLPVGAAPAEPAAATVDTAPVMEDAGAEQAIELQSTYAQVEAVELELAPPTVAAAGPVAADVAAPAAELEHAPIIVEAAFEPPDADAPAAEAEAASAPDLPVFDLIPEPAVTASARPDPGPVAAAEQPPGELVALEVAPLIAAPVAPPVRDDAPPIEIELDPIAVHLAHPEPTPEATEPAEGHSLELAAAPEPASGLATATARPTDAPTAATAAAPIVPVEQTIEATPAGPITPSAPVPPDEEAAQPPAAVIVREPPVALIEPAIEEPPAAVALPMSPSEPQGGEGEPEPVLSAEPPAPVIETLTGPPPADTATAARAVATEAPASTPEPLRQTGTPSPAWETVVWRAHAEPPAPIAAPAPADSIASNAASAATEPPATPAPNVTAPPAETPPAEPQPMGLADFLLEPLPPPVSGGAAAQPDSGPGVGSTTAPPFDPMAEIEEELFAAAPQVAPGAVPPAFDPAAILRPSAPMPEKAAPASAAPTQPAAPPKPQPAPSDPLAALKAMTDAERIALFT